MKMPVLNLYRFKIITTGIFLFTLLSCKTQQQAGAKAKITVSGTITQTSAYCGGAAPTDEIIAELETPKPYAGKKMHVIKGDTNLTKYEIVLTFVSDEKGNFSFRLAPGTYSIIADEQASTPDAKKYETNEVKMDMECFEKWWSKPYSVLHVSSQSITNLKFNFYKACFVNQDIPCLKFTGLPPP